MNAPSRVLRHERLARAAAVAALAALLALGGCGAGSPGSHLLPPSVPGKPYVGFCERVQGFDVWTVDGQYVRENLDEEFTNFGQHLNFKFIPARELWLDAENTPGEAHFFVAHLLEENGLMARGVPYDDALAKADDMERSERLASGPGREGAALLSSGRTAELIARIHKTLLAEYSDGVKVWIVDGELVRDVFFIDFTEGGHDKVYKFVPANEVWIDDDVRPGERRFILLHEMHERALMSRGWAYRRAHRDSSRIEYHYRRHPAGLDAALRAEIAKNRS
jgi:frataxin-like iron-binding protein CyaY